MPPTHSTKPDLPTIADRLRGTFPVFWHVLILCAGLLACLAASLCLGSKLVSLGEVGAAILGRDRPETIETTIIRTIRLPRTLTAALAGAALALSGLQMQTMFRNPLAGPYVLGVDSGASLGVALVTLSFGIGAESLLSGLGFAGGLGLLAAAMLGASATLAVVLAASLRLRSNVTLLIIGLMIGYFTTGIGGILFYLSEPESIGRYMQWTFGSFQVQWSSLGILAIAASLGLVAAVALIKPMDALLLGEEYAQSMGVAVGRTRVGLVLSASALAAGVTAVCGPIGFIGVATPHLARGLLKTSRHLILVPAVTLLGGILALVADILARLPLLDATLPLNAVTALFGAPLLVWLVVRRIEVSG